MYGGQLFRYLKKKRTEMEDGNKTKSEQARDQDNSKLRTREATQNQRIGWVGEL